jgi:hypothetical protein
MDEQQHNIIFNNREVLIVIRSLERMESALENQQPEPNELYQFEQEETLSLIRRALFKLKAVEEKTK